MVARQAYSNGTACRIRSVAAWQNACAFSPAAASEESRARTMSAECGAMRCSVPRTGPQRHPRHLGFQEADIVGCADASAWAKVLDIGELTPRHEVAAAAKEAGGQVKEGQRWPQTRQRLLP